MFRSLLNTVNPLLVFEMLDGTQTLEGPIDHDGQSSAEGLTLLHTGGTTIHNNYPSLFLVLLFHVFLIIISQISIVKSSKL